MREKHRSKLKSSRQRRDTYYDRVTFRLESCDYDRLRQLADVRRCTVADLARLGVKLVILSDHRNSSEIQGLDNDLPI